MPDPARPPSPRRLAAAIVVSAASAALLFSSPSPADDAERPAPAPKAVRGATINSIETIVADMREPNDMPLAGVPQHYGWAKGPGHVVMGNDPRGSRTPDWWRPADPKWKSEAWWNAVIPWFVVFDGVGNDATNTRVQVRNLRLFVKSRATGQWRQVVSSAGASGYLYPKTLQGKDSGRADVRNEPDGSVSIRPPGGNEVFHGWCCGRTPIDGSDVGAVFVTMQARLVRDQRERPDDRDRARYLIHVGADYYPDRDTTVAAFAPTGYNPGVGLSRAKRVTDEWQAFNFATIDAGVQTTPGASISTRTLRAVPPPLE